MSVMSCVSLRSHTSVRHKNSACPTTQESVLDSEGHQGISILKNRSHTHFKSGLVVCVALLQWDLVLSEVESSICLCPGWNELGVWRVLQTVVERRVWLTAFDSTLNGHGWAGPPLSEQHWSPRPPKEAIFHLDLKHSWTKDYSVGPMASVFPQGTVGKTARWLCKPHYYSQVFAVIYQEL